MRCETSLEEVREVFDNLLLISCANANSSISRIPRKAARWIQPVVRRMLGWPIGTHALSDHPSAQPRACAIARLRGMSLRIDAIPVTCAG
jgi:hypothetical protein